MDIHDDCSMSHKGKLQLDRIAYCCFYKKLVGDRSPAVVTLFFIHQNAKTISKL